MGNHGDYGGNMMGHNDHFSHEFNSFQPPSYDRDLLSYTATEVDEMEQPAAFDRSRPPH